MPWPSDPPGVPRTDIRDAVGDITRTVLDREVDPTVDIFDQGATSLALIRILAEVGERFGIAVDVGELEEASVDEMSVLVTRQVHAQEPVTARD